MRLGGACRALAGQTRCGDAFAWWCDGSVWTLCLVDGLGHGADASEAAEAALRHAGLCRSLEASAMLGVIDGGIRDSRGAAMAVVQVDAAQRSLTHAGVGNVRAALFGDRVLRFEGTPGIVGAGYRAPKAATATWQDGDLLVLWTDGFAAGLSLDPASRRLKGDPAALAQRLIETAATGRDDAGIVCCLLEGAPG